MLNFVNLIAESLQPELVLFLPARFMVAFNPVIGSLPTPQAFFVGSSAKVLAIFSVFFLRNQLVHR